MEELKKLEEQIEKLEESLGTAEDFDDVTLGHMELDDLRIKRNRLMKSLGIEAPPQSVYDKDYADHLKKEYDRAFTQGFTSEQLKKNLDRAIKGDFRDDWQKELDERKQDYNASGRGIDFNKELPETKTMVNQWFDYPPDYYKSMNYFRDIDMSIPSRQPNIAYMECSFGVDIETEQVFQQELHGIVDVMKVKLVDEKKILEGTLNPEYGKNEWSLPHIERTKNELSQSKPREQQWKNDSPNGCSTTDPIHISTSDSSSSSAFAELFNQSCPIEPLRIRSTPSPTSSCSENSAASGIETDVMNESSDCTVPMINEQMDGMPNEVKW